MMEELSSLKAENDQQRAEIQTLMAALQSQEMHYDNAEGVEGDRAHQTERCIAKLAECRSKLQEDVEESSLASLREELDSRNVMLEEAKAYVEGPQELVPVQQIEIKQLLAELRIERERQAREEINSHREENILCKLRAEKEASQRELGKFHTELEIQRKNMTMREECLMLNARREVLVKLDEQRVKLETHREDVTTRLQTALDQTQADLVKERERFARQRIEYESQLVQAREQDTIHDVNAFGMRKSMSETCL